MAAFALNLFQEGNGGGEPPQQDPPALQAGPQGTLVQRLLAQSVQEPFAQQTEELNSVDVFTARVSSLNFQEAVARNRGPLWQRPCAGLELCAMCICSSVFSKRL